MMGDAGSNLLGAVAGLAAVVAMPLWGRALLLLILLALNAAADKGHVAVAELLIARGGPLEGERFGQTALAIAQCQKAAALKKR